MGLSLTLLESHISRIRRRAYRSEGDNGDNDQQSVWEAKTKRRRMYLSSLVAEVVYRDNLPSRRLVQVGEEGADDGAPEVSEVELFDDVGRGVLDDDFFALARIVAAVLG